MSSKWSLHWKSANSNFYTNEEAERVRKNKLPKGIIFQVIQVKLDFNTSSIRKILAVLPSGMAEV